MPTLLEYFGLAEAPEKNISPAEIQQLWPQAMMAWDRDAGGVPATFLQRTTPGTREMTLFANSKGEGWWIYNPDGFGGKQNDDGSVDYDDLGQWTKISKPAQDRAADWQRQHGMNNSDGHWFGRGGPERTHLRQMARDMGPDDQDIARPIAGLLHRKNWVNQMPGRKGLKKKNV